MFPTGRLFMRTDETKPDQQVAGPHTPSQPARTSRVIKSSLAALVGAAVLATFSPGTASAASATVNVDKINGQFVVQGHNFPHSATGKLTATMGKTTCSKPVHTQSDGYFWAVCNVFAKTTGTANVKATVGKASASATKKFAAGSSSSSSSGTKPTTTTTAKPSSGSKTTSTTAKPTSSTTTPKSSSVKAAGDPSSSSAPAGWKLAWSDDFNSLDTSRWGIYDGTGNQGIGERRPSAVTVNNGELRITGHGDVAGGLASKSAQTYGRYEVRARLDGGSGYNTAILLWPSSEHWPVDGEIDASEIFNGDYGRSGNFVHWGSDNQQQGKFTSVNTSQWHTYTVDWTPNKITWYLDGQETMSTTTSAAIPHNDHFLGIQLDVAKSGSRTDGLTLHVDSVKVYKQA
jgi:hypothetical protein